MCVQENISSHSFTSLMRIFVKIPKNFSSVILRCLFEKRFLFDLLVTFLCQKHKFSSRVHHLNYFPQIIFHIVRKFRIFLDRFRTVNFRITFVFHWNSTLSINRREKDLFGQYHKNFQKDILERIWEKFRVDKMSLISRRVFHLD